MQRAFVPDLVFQHEDGSEALLVVGFWTPEDLAQAAPSYTGQFLRAKLGLPVAPA
jgi:hypothetical protein